MPINIHGNEYVTVAERVKAIHDMESDFQITTEVLLHDPVVIKATVKCKKGTFNGISAANPQKIIEKMSPYEVAETSAVGRALGFAGYGLVDSIATAEEIVKADVEKDADPEVKTPSSKPTTRQVIAAMNIARFKGYAIVPEDKESLRKKIEAMSASEVSDLIGGKLNFEDIK